MAAVDLLLNQCSKSMSSSQDSTGSGKIQTSPVNISKNKKIRHSDSVSQILAETIMGSMEIYSVVLNQKSHVKGKQQAFMSLAKLLSDAHPHGHTTTHQTVKKWVEQGIGLGTAEDARVTLLSQKGRPDDVKQLAHITTWGTVMQDYALKLRKESGQPNEKAQASGTSARYTAWSARSMVC